MARIVPNKEKWHKLSINDKYGGEYILMGSGRYTQLSTWTAREPGNFGYITGRQTLRKLAHEILRLTGNK